MSTKKNKKVDKEVDRATLRISKKLYKIYRLVTTYCMCQTTIAHKMKISRQAVNKHIRRLEVLGLIEPIDQNGNPKFYKPTNITPVVSTCEDVTHTPVLSKNAKEPERRVGSPYKVVKVRDKETGKIKQWKHKPSESFHRDYDTIVSVDGKRVPVLRVHSLAYSCNIVREPVEKVPWEKKDGPNGMEQWVLHHKFPNKKTEIDELREMEVTFVRQKTKTYDELVMYLPEKYLFEHELKKTEETMEQYALIARKWFQNKFKTWLGLPLMYRKMEIAHEIFEPGLKRYVSENGMVKVKTEGGFAMVDESQKGFPEKEYTSIDEVEVDLHVAERILSLEANQIQFQEQVRTIMDMMGTQQVQNKQIGDLLKAQSDNISELMGFKKKMDEKREKENKEMYQ